MTHTYKISGMTCNGCVAKVKWLLEQTDQVQAVAVDLEQGTATVDMQAHIPLSKLQDALKDAPKYQLSEQHQAMAPSPATEEAATKSWFQTYKPLLLVFAFIVGLSFITAQNGNGFQWDNWMNNFMAGFFLVFSFFKLLDLEAFATSYASYDIIARKWLGWGYVYAFTELALGIAYLVHFAPLLTNAVTFVVMSLSIIGVLQSVLQKRKIKCACLGAVFNLPMSTVTIIEDALMILMSALMFFRML